jgi:26S proteasome regulatory subunit N12
MDLDSLPPVAMETPSAEQERVMAREVFEHAVILAIKSSDKEAFQRFLGSLRPYYTGFGPAVSESAFKSPIAGLHLLFLLVENQLAEFHSELELLSEQQQRDPAISFCTQLERHLMIGSYDEVMQAAAAPPVEYYSFFLTSLLETVRLNICECVLAAYHSLTPRAAMQMLMFTSLEETAEFFGDHYPELEVTAATQTIDLRLQGHPAAAQKSDAVPSLKLIHQTLAYATELERIV